MPWRSDYIQGVVRRDAAAGKAGFVVIFDLPRLLTSGGPMTPKSAGGHLPPSAKGGKQDLVAA